MQVVLDPVAHVYSNTATGAKYTSVTNFISSYKKPFDKDYWSKQIAKREGVDQQTILDTWKSLTTTAQNKGTDIHYVMEQYIKDGVIQAEFEELTSSFAKRTKGIIRKDSNVMSETLLFHHDLQLAGTADLIVENGDFFHVLDFKTNKKFNFNSKYNEYFKPPLDYLQQCEFTTYTIQLSIYARLHELATGKKCSGLKVFYLREFADKFWQEINCAYMRSTVDEMFADKKKKMLDPSSVLAKILE